MRVKKRDGQFEEVSFDKITARIKKLCTDLNVDPIEVAKNICSRLNDGIETSQIDELTSEYCLHSSTNNLDFAKLGSRIIISNHHKNTPAKYSKATKKLYADKLVSKEVYDFVQDNKDILDKTIVDERDYDFDYFSFKTLERSYLLRTRSDKKVIERIQYLFMRVSVGLHHPNIEEVINSYNYMSQKYFTHASPTLFNSGTDYQQLLSCFLTAPEDSIDGMYKWLGDLAQISKRAGGIGGSISCLRSNGSFIRGTNGISGGIKPFLRVVNQALKHVNQGGRRKGAGAMYLEPHHPDVEDFLKLRLNNGAEDDRCRDLFLAFWVSDLFMRAVEKDEEWILFDPDECKGLDEVYGKEYEELYNKYKNEGKGKRFRLKEGKKEKIMARDIYNLVLDSMIETGVPYVLYKDNVNHKSNHSNIGIIKGSNLCAEILEYHDSKEYACCCLTSICLPRFIEDDKYNFKKLGEVTRQCVKNLNQVVDRNLYPVKETKVSNMRHRPLGIGVQGLADTFFKMRIPFERKYYDEVKNTFVTKVSKEADELNRDIFETMYYYAMLESMEQAKKHGTYETFKGSPLSQGKFQFDLWGVKPSDKYDWEQLRRDVMKHGVRNSLLIACMPTASTSQIMGCNECIEPMTSNIYARSTSAGDFPLINQYLIKDLEMLSMWNEQMKQRIIASDGSIQNIAGIPDDLKDLYKTVWEMKQKTLIDLSIGRGPFVCQTQSLNLFFKEPTRNKLSKALFYGWKNGLKTGSYYIRSNPESQAQMFTVDPSLEKEVKENKSDIVNEMDRSKHPEKKKVVRRCDGDVCHSCSG